MSSSERLPPLSTSGSTVDERNSNPYASSRRGTGAVEQRYQKNKHGRFPVVQPPLTSRPTSRSGRKLLRQSCGQQLHPRISLSSRSLIGASACHRDRSFSLMTLGMNMTPFSDNDSPVANKLWDSDLHFPDRGGCVPFIRCHRSSSMKQSQGETWYAAKRNSTGATPPHKSTMSPGGVMM